MGGIFGGGGGGTAVVTKPQPLGPATIAQLVGGAPTTNNAPQNLNANGMQNFAALDLRKQFEGMQLGTSTAVNNKLGV